MTDRQRIAVIGAGIVGARVARELLTPMVGAGPSNTEVVLVTRRSDRHGQLTRSFGRSVRVELDGGDGVEVGDDVAVVVIARAAGEHLELVRSHLEAGRHVVSTSDDSEEVAALLELGDRARSQELSVTVGAAMSPGLSCLLAAHAATLLDHVDEVHVARRGVAGPACARQRLRALRGTALDWRDGEWVRRPGFSGRELDWFPDPVGGRDCFRADLAEPLLLHAALPTAQRVTARLAASRRDRALAPFPVLVPPPEEGGMGAVRVEVRGERGGSRATVVYGALDRPGIASGAVAAVAATEALAGRMPSGAAGLASSGREVQILRELARRGVRSATFEGGSGLASDLGPAAKSAQVSAGSGDQSHTE